MTPGMHPRWRDIFNRLPEHPEPEPIPSRTYLVGLPVVITVADDGSVTYEIATDEASEAIRDHNDYDDPIPDDVFQADQARIEADHQRRQENSRR